MTIFDYVLYDHIDGDLLMFSMTILMGSVVGHASGTFFLKKKMYVRICNFLCACGANRFDRK